MLDEDGRTVGEVLGPFFEVELAKFLSVDSNTKLSLFQVLTLDTINTFSSGGGGKVAL